ncbi:hypothetical protein Sar04_44640 [Salinispora arenicola]|uniref:Uncharacterized protein n=1 Tax=Salinispora arenicola TaxID=168697 RepID=A0ABQ4JXZ6_SALAC|nr:hypothetical protein Sar04_44640 [Salinispora arenicola]
MTKAPRSPLQQRSGNRSAAASDGDQPWARTARFAAVRAGSSNGAACGPGIASTTAAQGWPSTVGPGRTLRTGWSTRTGNVRARCSTNERSPRGAAQRIGPTTSRRPS